MIATTPYTPEPKAWSITIMSGGESQARRERQDEVSAHLLRHQVQNRHSCEKSEGAGHELRWLTDRDGVCRPSDIDGEHRLPGHKRQALHTSRAGEPNELWQTEHHAGERADPSHELGDGHGVRTTKSLKQASITCVGDDGDPVTFEFIADPDPHLARRDTPRSPA